MKSILVKHDRSGYISEEIPIPTRSDATTRELTRWNSNEEKATNDIILSIDDAELKTVSKCTTSKEVWDNLQSVHTSKGSVRKIELLTDITSFKIDEDGDFREKLDTFTSAVEQLESMEIDIPKDMLVGINTKRSTAEL
ncbi:unnamed protein product [Hermetia illucens]|uniref:Gag-pol polyprotein n=1 Tax=Hermetia illucens TaxID=343691 RepID=A0A7R8YVG6_HERIL|nr:unnamed protein product [Hermetia illucens]